jgi:hypothetical protein
MVSGWHYSAKSGEASGKATLHAPFIGFWSSARSRKGAVLCKNLSTIETNNPMDCQKYRSLIGQSLPP